MTDEEKAEEYAKQITRLEEDKDQIIFETDFKIKALEGMVEELEKENARLREYAKFLQQTNGSLTDKVEKMKCCGNCKKRHSCINHNNFVYPEMTNPINYGCHNLSKWELAE